MSNPDSFATPAPRRAAPEDEPAVLLLLERAGLVAAGVSEWLSRFRVADAKGALVGVAGLEVYGDDALLRSVAVAADRRGQGLGDQLVAAVLEDARAAGVERVFLLTETAEAYFARRGFRTIPRDQASDAVRQSIEFREACPTTATLMVREFDGTGWNRS